MGNVISLDIYRKSGVRRAPLGSVPGTDSMIEVPQSVLDHTNQHFPGGMMRSRQLREITGLESYQNPSSRYIEGMEDRHDELGRLLRAVMGENSAETTDKQKVISLSAARKRRRKSQTDDIPS